MWVTSFLVVANANEIRITMHSCRLRSEHPSISRLGRLA